MKTKIITLLFAMLASISMSFAEIIENEPIGDFYYRLNTVDKTAEVIGLVNSDLSVANIPSYIMFNNYTYSVISIGEEAFTGNYC